MFYNGGRLWMQSMESSCRNVTRTFYQMQVMLLKKED